MSIHLTNDAADLPNLLDATKASAVEYLASIDERPPATAFVPRPPLSLPADGLGAAETLTRFNRRYGTWLPASNGPRFWGFVTGGTTPAALMGDWLASTYDINLTSAANSPAPNIELEAIALLRELFNLPAAFDGTFVTGATMANFTGLAMGREWIARQQGRSVADEGLAAVGPVAVLSGEVHSSVPKALAMLGIGRRSLHRVATLPGTREAVDVAALAEELARLGGVPCIVVANAGTVNSVDFDDLAAIGALKEQYPCWLHVDAAFGGFAACSPQYAHLVRGMAAADSIAVDAHKWLNVPYDAAMIFTRHRSLQVDVFQNSAAYLGEIRDPIDFVHLSPENSRRLRALPAWFTLMAYGRNGYRQIVEQNCELARLLGAKIEGSAAFRLLAPVRLNVACFTLAADPTSTRIAAFLARLRNDGRVFLTPTVFQGTPGIRAAFSNWRTTAHDVELAFEAMLSVTR